MFICTVQCRELVFVPTVQQKFDSIFQFCTFFLYLYTTCTLIKNLRNTCFTPGKKSIYSSSYVPYSGYSSCLLDFYVPYSKSFFSKMVVILKLFIVYYIVIVKQIKDQKDSSCKLMVKNILLGKYKLKSLESFLLRDSSLLSLFFVY